MTFFFESNSNVGGVVSEKTKRMGESQNSSERDISV